MSTKTFFPIPSPFGTGIDEQATIEAFKDYVGSKDRLEQLSRLLMQSYPMPKYPSGQYTRLESFRMKAVQYGFSHEEIDGFLTFAG